MKISEKWLRTWVNPKISTDELVAMLTMAGLEVDGTENLGADLAGVLVGEIVKTSQHPEADKLQICEVDVGNDKNLQIICGAPNARKSIKVAVAVIGCVLPGDFKIKKAKLRGVQSFGMLCSGKELELSDEQDGIIELSQNAVVGQELIDHLGLKDTAIDIDLTPNRGDCLGIKGVATEVGVLTQSVVKSVNIPVVKATIDDVIQVKLTVPKANPRFVSRIISNIDISAKTPEWMATRLLASGIRSIDPVVDVTNYVMMELGHPMHAFDKAKVSGELIVRYATDGEEILLLDEQTIKLKSNTLVVADEDKALSIAGIMGGKYSGVSSATKDIVLEAAHWDPIKIAGKARSYGLHTDASHRFERGVDFETCANIIERATQLLLDIVGGEAGPINDEIDTKHFPQIKSIKLRRTRIERLLGIQMPDEQVVDILNRLEMSTKDVEDGWLVTVPSARFDISIEADLIEELVRIYGYNNIPSRKPVGELSMIRKPEKHIEKLKIAKLLANRGFQESITYSFVDKESQQIIDPKIEPLPLLNPISAELAVMRSSLWPGLLNVVAYNQKRQQDSVKIFEIGLKFVPTEDGLVQTPVIAGAISGRNKSENWEASNNKVDFYDLKADLEAIFKQTSNQAQFSFVASQREGLHPGQTAEIYRNGQSCGFIGKCHPETQQSFDIGEPVYLFEMTLKSVSQRKIPKFNALSKYPSIRRDIAILVKEDVTSTQIVDLIGQTAKNWLNNIIIFDIYRGKGIEEGYKSVAIGFTLQRSDRTFKESEIAKTLDRVISAFQQKLGAVLRD